MHEIAPGYNSQPQVPDPEGSDLSMNFGELVGPAEPTNWTPEEAPQFATPLPPVKAAQGMEEFSLAHRRRDINLSRPPLTDAEVAHLGVVRGKGLTDEEVRHINGQRLRGVHNGY